jgi:hypothetical protein
MFAALALPWALVMDVRAASAAKNTVKPTTVVSSAANDQLLYFTSTSKRAICRAVVPQHRGF